MATVNRNSLDKLAQSTDVVPGNILAEVCDFLLAAGGSQLVNMKPFRLAVAWHVDRLTPLKAFLHLTQKGLFNLYWTVHRAKALRSNPSRWPPFGTAAPAHSATSTSARGSTGACR